MKNVNKFIVVICFILFMNNSNNVYATKNIETSINIQTYNVPIISNENTDATVTFYENNGKYYLSLEDIKNFTRCELKESNSQLILSHGLRKIVIDKDTGNMIDSGFVQKDTIDILKYDEKYLCEGIPMLIYLGAACSIKDDKALEVLMPSITIWESIMPNYLAYYIDIVKLLGGKDKKQWVKYFSDTSGNSVNNDVANYLYRITNCTIVPIVEYSKITDDLISNNWINNFENSIPDLMQYLNNYDGLMSEINLTLTEKRNNLDQRYISAETEGFYFDYGLDNNSLEIRSENFANVSVSGVVNGIDYAEAKKLLSQNNWYDVTSIEEVDEGDTKLENVSFATVIDDDYYQLFLGYDQKDKKVKYWIVYNFCSDNIKGRLAYNSVNEDWKKAYINYIMENGMNYNSLSNSYWETYKLVNIDGDNIPELYINFGTTAGGDVICTYQKEKLCFQNMWNSGFSYIEEKNKFIDSGGHMDVYHDIVYTIENGNFTKIFEGNYGAADNSNVQRNDNGPVYEYFVDGVQVASEKEYQNALNANYDTENDNNPYDNAEFDSNVGRYVGNGLCDYEEIIKSIKNY